MLLLTSEVLSKGNVGLWQTDINADRLARTSENLNFTDGPKSQPLSFSERFGIGVPLSEHVGQNRL